MPLRTLLSLAGVGCTETFIAIHTEDVVDSYVQLCAYDELLEKLHDTSSIE